MLCEQPAFVESLSPGEVELQVQAVGLNFRDVLLVLGEYPGPPEPPGSDCSGILAAHDAAQRRKGDIVFGIGPGGLIGGCRDWDSCGGRSGGSLNPNPGNKLYKKIS